MGEKNVNTSVPLVTYRPNPTVELDTSGVNSLIVGKVGIVLRSVGTSTPTNNSFMRNIVEPVVIQYVSHENF
ncbi:hypothetical protein Ddye_008393 [Dipteronia dyeriana]|uniref:Uncharacterized protein n=1 Tax=Dipteronia dyeriana TaxID=168575 RepID=A0AAD9X9W0_9ROSI|nr:hypothetical protein Ddye_008393 [Dipteronia dyeriana]